MQCSQTMQVALAAKASYREETREEEREVEAAKGSDLKKGAERVEERAKAANGKGPKAE